MPGWLVAQAVNSALLIGLAALLVYRYHVRTARVVGAPPPPDAPAVRESPALHGAEVAPR